MTGRLSDGFNKILVAPLCRRAVGCADRDRERDSPLSDVALTAKLHRLGEPPDLARDVVAEERRGVDPDESVLVQSPSDPSWNLTSVEVNGEEHRVACDGGGPEMVRVTMPEQQLLRDTRLGEPGAERTKWRCTRCRFATYNPEVMARHAIREAGEGEAPDPGRLPDLVLAEHGALTRDRADGPGGPA